MDRTDKIVNFAKYCIDCKYYQKPEWTDPCNECLDEPVNVQTDKPVKFEKKEK